MMDGPEYFTEKLEKVIDGWKVKDTVQHRPAIKVLKELTKSIYSRYYLKARSQLVEQAPV
jgi:PP-loop superfamily ATP-utilizing enzyme